MWEKMKKKRIQVFFGVFLLTFVFCVLSQDRVAAEGIQKVSSGRVLKKDVDYKVTYSADSTAVGEKKVAIEGSRNYTGSLEKNYSVVPAKAEISSVKAGKRKLTVRIVGQEGAMYQIQYRMKGRNSWSSARTTGTKKVLKNLKSGKFEIRVRACVKLTVRVCMERGAMSRYRVW